MYEMSLPAGARLRTVCHRTLGRIDLLLLLLLLLGLQKGRRAGAVSATGRMAMRGMVLLAMSGVASAIPTLGRQLQSALPDKCSDPESFQGGSAQSRCPCCCCSRWNWNHRQWRSRHSASRALSRPPRDSRRCRRQHQAQSSTLPAQLTTCWR